MDIDQELFKVEEKLDIKKQRFEAIGTNFVNTYHENQNNLRAIVDTFELMYNRYVDMCDSYFKCKARQLRFKEELLSREESPSSS